MNNTEDDRKLHLVRVCENKRIFSSVPAGIDTHGISMAIGHSPRGVGGEVPSRVEDVQRLGEDVVVQESGVHREQTHKQDDVPAAAALSATSAPMTI